MRKLIYYKINKNDEMIEGNADIITKSKNISYKELRLFRIDARKIHDTYNRPIIIGIIDIDD